MSGRETPPQVGSALLTAVAASLAAIRTHLTDPDPKVSLRASAELTKLLSVCARHGIELTSGDREETASREGEAPSEPPVLVAPEEKDPSLTLPTPTDPVRREPYPPEDKPAPSRSRLVDDARPRPRRTPFHELHARRDRPPHETARPPSAIPA